MDNILLQIPILERIIRHLSSQDLFYLGLVNRFLYQTKLQLVKEIILRSTSPIQMDHFLWKYPAIQTLELDRFDYDIEATLNRYPGIVNLRLNVYGINTFHPELISQIRFLDLSKSTYLSNIFKRIKLLPKLRRLDVSNNYRLYGRSLYGILQITQLETLIMKNVDGFFSIEYFNKLSGMTNLRQLDLRGSPWIQQLTPIYEKYPQIKFILN